MNDNTERTSSCCMIKELTEEELNEVSGGFWAPAAVFLIKAVITAFIGAGVQRCTNGK